MFCLSVSADRAKFLCDCQHLLEATFTEGMTARPGKWFTDELIVHFFADAAGVGEINRFSHVGENNKLVQLCYYFLPSSINLFPN